MSRRDARRAPGALSPERFYDSINIKTLKHGPGLPVDRNRGGCAGTGRNPTDSLGFSGPLGRRSGAKFAVACAAANARTGRLGSISCCSERGSRPPRAREASMRELTTLIPRLLQGGLGNVASYLAAHVPCACCRRSTSQGAMTAMIAQADDHALSGPAARRRLVSYRPPPLRVGAGRVLVHHRPAVCRHPSQGAGIARSDVPVLRAGRQHSRPGLHGHIIGPTCLARLSCRLAFASASADHALLFHDDDAAHDQATGPRCSPRKRERGLERGSLAFMAGLGRLAAGRTRSLGFLTDSWASLRIPLAARRCPVVARATRALRRLTTARRASRSGRGAVLLLAGVGYASWRGFERIRKVGNRWTGIALR